MADSSGKSRASSANPDNNNNNTDQNNFTNNTDNANQNGNSDNGSNHRPPSRSNTAAKFRAKPGGAVVSSSGQDVAPRSDNSHLNLRDHLATIEWEKVKAEKEARLSRMSMSNKSFVDAHQLPFLFEALVVGLMVVQPEEPISFLVDCLVKVELENPEKYDRNMFVPGMQADGSRVLADGTRVLADGTRILPDGTRILPDGTQILPDGTKILPDGTRILPDGTRILPDGTQILPDGTKILPDGTRILPDGTRILPDGTKILPDGTKILPDGTRILPDGTRILPDGTKILPDGTRILPDGTRILPDGTKILPDGTRILPDGTRILPDGTKILPDGTRILPDGTRILPDGTKILPDGTKILPDGTKILPDGTKILTDGTWLLPNGMKILADGTILNTEEIKLGQLKPGWQDLSPEELKVAIEQAIVEYAEQAEKDRKARARRKKRARALWLLAAKLAKERVALEKELGIWGMSLSEAEKLRLIAENEERIAKEALEAARRKRMLSEELVGKNTIGRQQSQSDLSSHIKKEEEVKTMIQTLKSQEGVEGDSNTLHVVDVPVVDLMNLSSTSTSSVFEAVEETPEELALQEQEVERNLAELDLERDAN